MAHMEYDDVRGPLVVQLVGGDLRIRGRAGTRLIVDGDGVQAQRPPEGEPFIVQSAGDLRLNIPQGLDVTVQTVGGNAKLTEIGGMVHVQSVGGDLVVRQASAVTIQSVGGDLRLNGVSGDVDVQAVGGDATVRKIDGAARIQAVGEDLYLRNVSGDCVVDKVGDDLVLSLAFAEGKTYRFRAEGDILCRVQQDANVRFTLPAETDLRMDMHAEVSEDKATGRQIITLGAGDAEVHILGAETLFLMSEAEGYMLNFSAQLEEEIEARLSWLEEKLDRQLEGLDAHLQKRAEQWSKQAERWMEDVFGAGMDKPRKPKRKRRTPGPRRMRFTATFGRPPHPPRHSPPPPPKEPVSDDERRMILQMVRDGKISIEEAEQLLAALDE